MHFLIRLGRTSCTTKLSGASQSCRRSRSLPSRNKRKHQRCEREKTSAALFSAHKGDLHPAAPAPARPSRATCKAMWACRAASRLHRTHSTCSRIARALTARCAASQRRESPSELSAAVGAALLPSLRCDRPSNLQLYPHLGVRNDHAAARKPARKRALARCVRATLCCAGSIRDAVCLCRLARRARSSRAVRHALSRAIYARALFRALYAGGAAGVYVCSDFIRDADRIAMAGSNDRSGMTR